MPAPAAMVSATCFSTESPGAIAAAMPPCAQAEGAPSPNGDAAEPSLRRHVVQLNFAGVAEGADTEDLVLLLDHVHVLGPVGQPAHQILGRLVGRPALDDGAIALVVGMTEVRDRLDEDAAH